MLRTAPRPFALLATVAALAAATAVSPAAAQAKTKRCPGTVRFSGATTTLAVSSPTRCRTARRIVADFDRIISGGPMKNGYGCFYAKAPFRERFGRRVGFTCKKNGGRATRIYGLLPG